MHQSFMGMRRLKKHQQKLLATMAVILTCFLIVVSFCALVHQEYGDTISKSRKQKVVQGVDESDLVGVNMAPTRKRKNKAVGMCKMGTRSDFCDMKGDIRLDKKSATIYYVVSSDQSTDSVLHNKSIKPYPRKGDTAALRSVREWTVKMVPKSDHQLPQCSSDQTNYSPAIILSLGGYFGNYFHAFTDVLVSLYEVVNIDNNHEGDKYKCFTRLILGLKGRQDKELSINPSESEYTINDFRDFLRSAYSLHKTTAIKLNPEQGTKPVPRIMIINRERTRTITNVEDIAKMARQLGYVVLVSEIDTNVTRSAEITNSCDVLIGVHGAGMTNMVFLPENAVLIQIVPFGVDWLSKYYIAEPSKEMKLKYLEYKVGVEESTLKNQYPADDVVFKNPAHFGWEEFNRIYLQEQDVTLDAKKFEVTLLKALKLLH
ncbi:Alpha-1,3-arabinosyltransferase XAT3 [Linum grandiflorum]